MDEFPADQEARRSGKLVAVLLYLLEQGPVERQIIEMAMKQNLPLPDKIKNAPSLLPGMELYFHAYEELASYCALDENRPTISWRDVHTYAEYEGFSPYQREDLIYFVREMEHAAIKFKKRRGAVSHGNRVTPTVPTNARVK